MSLIARRKLIRKAIFLNNLLLQYFPLIIVTKEPRLSSIYKRAILCLSVRMIQLENSASDEKK